ncbi:MAG: ROK family protein [Acidobacteriaceae bacterium]
MPTAPQQKAPAPQGATILCFDIGGSGLKAMLMNVNGEAASERIRIATPDPPSPDAVLRGLRELAANFDGYAYVSCGFPGVIKKGIVHTAHNLDPEWQGYDLLTALKKLLGVHVRVANDAAVQGMGAIRGRGLELCLTLGTGMGSSLFIDGVLVPGLELGHHPFRKGKTYEDYLGSQGLKRIGKRTWNKRLEQAVATAERLFNYDHLYIGGGNNRLIKFPLPANATLIENLDGLKGGAALWRDVIQTEGTLVREQKQTSPASTISRGPVNRSPANAGKKPKIK